MLSTSNPSPSNFVISNFKELYAWARANSLWTFAWNLSCCGVEFLSCIGPRYDWERFGSILQTEPTNSDLLIVAGPVTKSLVPILRETYQKMLAPRYVIAMGSCANTGGMFFEKSPHVVAGIDQILPVDVYVPGCPPRPEALIHGLITLQRKICFRHQPQAGVI